MRLVADVLGVPRSTIQDRVKRRASIRRERTKNRDVLKRRAALKSIVTMERRVEGRSGKTQRSASSVIFRRVFPSIALMGRELRRRGFAVSNSTVCRDLRALKLTARTKPRGPIRKLPDFESRTNFANDELRQPHLCDETVFVDESMMDTNNHGSQFEWCFPNQTPHEREYYNFAPKVHVWGAIGINFKELIFLPDRAIDADDYRRLCLLPLLRVLGKRRLVQDNARCHVKNNAWLKKRKIDVVSWPARSPDLSPIESLWGIVKKRVSDRGPTHPDELKAFVKEEFDAIPMKTINALVRSYPSRLRTVLRTKGATITAAKRRFLDRQALKRTKTKI